MWQQLDILINRETQESEREFYGLIGLVAVRFARLEAKLTDLLGTLIHPNDIFLAAALTENFNLSKTIELINKIGRLRSIDKIQLQNILVEANSLRQDRNDYVHGLWEIQVLENGDVIGRCSRRTISYKQDGSHVKGYKSKSITIQTLASTALKLETLSQEVEKFIEEIEQVSSDLL